MSDALITEEEDTGQSFETEHEAVSVGILQSFTTGVTVGDHASLNPCTLFKMKTSVINEKFGLDDDKSKTNS